MVGSVLIDISWFTISASTWQNYSLWTL